ncbi:MAG: mechanosensitive ion channel [Fibrobacteria bacterium]|nr:mechanosensitive ion channel [Fibrobacteria bacterium]
MVILLSVSLCSELWALNDSTEVKSIVADTIQLSSSKPDSVIPDTLSSSSDIPQKENKNIKTELSGASTSDSTKLTGNKKEIIQKDSSDIEQTIPDSSSTDSVPTVIKETKKSIDSSPVIDSAIVNTLNLKAESISDTFDSIVTLPQVKKLKLEPTTKDSINQSPVNAKKEIITKIKPKKQLSVKKPDPIKTERKLDTLKAITPKNASKQRIQIITPPDTGKVTHKEALVKKKIVLPKIDQPVAGSLDKAAIVPADTKAVVREPKKHEVVKPLKPVKTIEEPTVKLEAPLKISEPEPKKDESIKAKAPVLLENKDPVTIIKASKIITTIFLLIFGWFLLHYIGRILDILSERWPRYRLSIKGIIPIVRILGWTSLLTFIIIAVFRPPIQSVIAFTASAGIAIGFASQDILKNIFGGIVILFDKPFKVGDKIKIDEHYGEVVNIGLRTVRICTADDSQVAIPNMEIVSKSVSNSNSGETDCQVVSEFYFPETLNVDEAHVLATRCAYLSRYVYLNKPVSIVFQTEMHGPQIKIKMRLKAYVFDHRFEGPFQTDMTKTVLREFRKAGIGQGE